jgi:C-terminal processing protease CtpA/Prc
MLSLLERAYFAPVGYVGIVMQSARSGPNGFFQPGNNQAGVKITRVAPGTPAEASGLQVNDIILEIGDWKVGNEDDVREKVASRIQSNPPGAQISLGVKRGDKFLRLNFKLGVLPVPSARAALIREADETAGRLLPVSLQREIKEFRSWLEEEIRKDRKNLIAD